MSGLVTKVIRIGNSQGIRIPKAVLEQCHLGTDVVLEPGEDRLVVRRAADRRTNWDVAFKAMAEAGDDALVDGEEAAGSCGWDQEEWEW